MQAPSRCYTEFGYVKETISILEQAKQLTEGEVFVVNWIAGIVHAQLPASLIKGRRPRPSWAGAWKTPTRRLMQDGCGKFTITWENSQSRRENSPRRKTIFGGAATKTLTGRLRS